MTTDTRNLGELAQQIAAALNDETVVTLESEGFTFEAPEDGERHYVRLTHPDGRRFSINATWNGNGKLHVSGDYPKCDGKYMGPREWGVIGYNEQAPTINVSAERELHALARDIARRFLIAYTELYRACVAKQQDQAAYRAQVNGAAAQLAALIPGAELRERDGTQSVHFYRTEQGYGDMMAYSDTVNMDLRSLPLALALKVAAVLGER